MSEAPAGKLAYPGATLTNSQSSYGDSDEVTRTYSLATGATAEQIIDWYTQALAQYGYAPEKGFSQPVLQGPRGIYAEYDGTNLFRLALELHIAQTARAVHGDSYVTNASKKDLSRPVDTITVSIG